MSAMSNMLAILFQFELRNDRVKVFEQVSRNQNIVLKPRKRQLEDTLTAVASQYLGKVIHVGWPHLVKAIVVRVATRDQRVDSEGITLNDSRRFDSECKALQEQLSVKPPSGPAFTLLMLHLPFPPSPPTTALSLVWEYSLPTMMCSSMCAPLPAIRRSSATRGH